MEKEKVDEKKECYDCWRRKFRRRMTESAKADSMPLSQAFDILITEREHELEKIRKSHMNLRDEILELRLLAGDHFMNRYKEHEEKGK